MKHHSVHWFRKGLRLHDNPSLIAALKSSRKIWPIFILDPHFVKSGTVGINRWRFLLESLMDLDRSFQELGSRLFVIRGSPAEVFPKIFKDWEISQLTFETDTEPYARQRDSEVIKLAEEHEVKVVQTVSHTLFDSEKIIKANGGKPPLTYQRMQTVLSKMGPPSEPMAAPTKEDFTECKTPEESDHSSKYGVPTLEDLGLSTKGISPVIFPGGETEALNRMERYLARDKWVCNFEKPKTSPNSLKASTTVLSPYLKFGCLSVRSFYYGIQAVYSGKTHSKPPVSLHGQLLWREFFYTAAAGTPNFHQMKGNPVSLQIPWDENRAFLDAWTWGKTGYPFIDAIMTQLRKEGWIHHLARHAVACFLTRGDLWISWEEGERVFEELLLDADYSLNAGNWMWLSASAFFHQYFRVYSPIVFGKKTDPNGDYIKKYLPILKKFPPKYIYEPWLAPRSMQEQAGCIIGEDYPKPIVDHATISKKNISRMKEARANQLGTEGKKSASTAKDGKRKFDDASDEKPPPSTKSKRDSKKQKKLTQFMKK
ncbi:cryptochrome-1-like [Apostichopus japonicus]|uniref:cryptochrome-1-like n=1 Tax=Stichopus japonicus TaxID=307972 RepID=UPI003AB8C670